MGQAWEREAGYAQLALGVAVAVLALMVWGWVVVTRVRARKHPELEPFTAFWPVRSTMCVACAAAGIAHAALPPAATALDDVTGARARGSRAACDAGVLALGSGEALFLALALAAVRAAHRGEGPWPAVGIAVGAASPVAGLTAGGVYAGAMPGPSSTRPCSFPGPGWAATGVFALASAIVWLRVGAAAREKAISGRVAARLRLLQGLCCAEPALVVPLRAAVSTLDLGPPSLASLVIRLSAAVTALVPLAWILMLCAGLPTAAVAVSLPVALAEGRGKERDLPADAHSL